MSQPRDPGRVVIGRLLVALLLLGVGVVAQEARPARTASQYDAPPHLLVFLVDDLGWQDVSVPMHAERTPFNDRYHTPHLERLAAEGLVLTDAYAAAPVCTPTRTSLMTGRSPAATGITYWILHGGRDTSAKHATLDPPAWTLDGLQEGDVTLPSLLDAAGYHTIHVGKAHLGARGTSGADPERLGFDVNVAGHAVGGPGSFLGRNDFSAAHRGGARTWDVPGLEEHHGEDVFLTDVLAERAVREVRAAVERGERVFLHMAPYAVHAPIEANEKHLARYEGLHPTEAAYATMIQSVDEALGALLSLLDELDIADETLVVFTSDNGGLSAHARGGDRHTHNAPLRSGKGSSYEGGVRVPMVVRWPGVVAPGTRTDVPVITHDLFPTLLAAAGVAHADPAIEGRDLAPLLRGEPAEDERPLFWHMPHFWGVSGPGIEPYSAVRRGDWKLLYYHADRRLELYDLDADLSEAHDLAAQEPERVAALAEVLSAWCERVGAGMSRDRSTGRPVPLPRDVVAR